MFVYVCPFKACYILQTDKVPRDFSSDVGLVVWFGLIKNECMPHAAFTSQRNRSNVFFLSSFNAVRVGVSSHELVEIRELVCHVCVNLNGWGSPGMGAQCGRARFPTSFKKKKKQQQKSKAIF